MTEPLHPTSPAAVLQSRGVGVTEALRELLPAWGVEAFGVVTQLGDVWLLLTLAVLAYWGYGHRPGGFVLGALFVAFGVTIGAKAWFALPRPPAALPYVATGVGGSFDAAGTSRYGFPSGHAVTATVGWGALAVALDRLWSARRRAAVAAVVVLTVGLSRLALGVHYLVDVAAGVALGLVVLAVVASVGRETLLGLFALGGGLALAAVGITGGGFWAVALLGATAGAGTAWQVVEPATGPRGRTGVATAAGVGVVLLGVVAVVAPGHAAAFVAGALSTAAVLLAPAAAERGLGLRPQNVSR